MNLQLQQFHLTSHGLRRTEIANEDPIMEGRNHRMRRVTTWALAVGSFACVAGYILWSVLSDQFSAREAQLHPLAAARIIISQIGQSAPPSEWNVPVRGIVVFLAWIAGIFGSGNLIGRYFLHNKFGLTASEGGVLSFALGFVAYAMAQLLLGLLGFARFPLIAVFFAVTVLTLFSARGRRDLVGLPRAVLWRWRNLKIPGRLMWIAAAVAIAMLAIPALTPPAQSDGVRYHLGAPQEYIKAGAIDYLPHNAYSNMPFLVEMHFLGALACRAPEASQLMHLSLALFAALGIYCLVGRFAFNGAAPPARWLALLPALLYIGTPMSGILAGWPFTDHGICFFLLASILAALLCADPAATWKTWAVLGIAAGGLIGTKYTMGPVAVLIVLLPLWFRKQADMQGHRHYGFVVLALAIMAAIGGTWYVKNLVFTGNPFYPLASGWFPGGDWSAANDEFLHVRAGAKGLGHGLLNLISSPLGTTFRWVKFEAHNPGSTLLLALIAVVGALLASGRRIVYSPRFPLVLLLMFMYAIWFLSYQSNRLLLPIVALALCLSPVELFYNATIARRIYALAMTLASACGFTWAIQWSWVSTGLTPPPLPYLMGAQDKRSFRYKSLTYARAYDYLNDAVAADEKVLLVGEHRIYGAQFEALWSDWFDTPVLAAILRENNIASTDGLLDYLRKHNILWIMINERELEPQLERDFRPWFTSEEWQIFEKLRTLSGPGIKVINLPPGVRIMHLVDKP